MKTLLTILGGLCAAAAVAFVALVSVAAFTGPSYDKESKLYADAAVVAIASGWNEKHLTERASPQLIAAANGPAQLDREIAMWRTLGPLKKYDGSKGAAHIVFDWPGGEIITATYTSRVEFDRGSATIDIALIKSDGAWRIRGFRVVPDFLSGAQTAKSGF